MKELFLLTLILVSGVAQSQAIYDRDSRFYPTIVPAGKGVVVSQDQIASQVGARILAQGGNAIDAAVATGFALAVTFPQAGNLGGGGFMLVNIADSEESYALDYREVAPLSAYPDMYLKGDGTVDAQKKRFGIESVGVPGTVAGLLFAQEQWGRLERAEVLRPAIKLASDGFIVSDSLSYSLGRAASRFQTDATKAYFLGEDGEGYSAGETLVQTDLAATLQRILDTGHAGFYEGKTAELLVEQVARLGGDISFRDLSEYRPLLRAPVVGNYLSGDGEYEIVSMPPPSSGGVHLIQMLKILERCRVGELEHNSANYLHLLVETMKPAYADRSLHLGDPDFVDVPVEKLSSKAYAESLAKTISLTAARPSSEILATEFHSNESSDTTHYSVWDSEGNVVSNTYTLNFSYGNGIAVDGAGFLLNNEMDDFSAAVGASNAYGLVGGLANAIAPSKRPLSSMTPTIVLKNGKPLMATGSPGGSRIITTVLQSILNVLEFDMNAAEAVSAPRIHHQWQPDQIYWEEGVSLDTRTALQEKGQTLADVPRTFGKLEVILKVGETLQAASDPRWPDSGVAIESD